MTEDFLGKRDFLGKAGATVISLGIVGLVFMLAYAAIMGCVK